jgi:hypothetical protein
MSSYIETKQRSDFTPSSVVVTDNNSGNHHVWFNGQTGTESSIAQQCTPGWRKLVKKGDIVMSYMQLGRTERTLTSEGSVDLIYPGQDSTYRGDFCAYVRGEATPPLDTPNPSNLARVRNLALTAALAKCNDPEMLSGEFLATMSSTVRMLRSPFSGAGNLIRKMRKHRNKNLKKSGSNLLKANGETWLEYRYGWKPLMADIESIMNHIIRSNNNEKRRFVGRSTQSETTYSDQNVDVRLRGDFQYLVIKGTYSKEEILRCSAGVIAEIDAASAMKELSEAFGFGLHAIPATLWELTPYSFVVDWFANVDTWVRSITIDPRVTLRSNWVTAVSNITVSFLGDELIVLPYYYTLPTLYGIPGSDAVHKLLITRTPNQSMPTTPVLLKNPLSITHAVDAMSLLASRLLGGVANFRH